MSGDVLLALWLLCLPSHTTMPAPSTTPNPICTPPYTTPYIYLYLLHLQSMIFSTFSLPAYHHHPLHTYTSLLMPPFYYY